MVKIQNVVADSALDHVENAPPQDDSNQKCAAGPRYVSLFACIPEHLMEEDTVDDPPMQSP